MRYQFAPALLSALASTALAGETLWDGKFTADTSSELSSWSWSNQKGAYQYYIHGSGELTDYVNTGADFKNPASSDAMGAKISIDSTSQWNSGGMLRTELIPQTTAAINEGTVYYHFSMMRKEENAPNAGYEHQVNFFESHFTEMKYGLISGASGTQDTSLRWYANSESQWNVTFEAGVWHNVAYEIDFSGGSVTFWHSTGSDELTKVAGPVSVSASSNGADWHLGVLRLNAATDATAEDWYFSGVYIESGDLTTSVGSGSASSGSTGSSSAASSAAPATSAASSSSSSVAVQEAATSTPVPTTSSAAAIVSTPAAQVSSVAPTTLQTVVSSTSSTAAASTATGQTGSVPAEGNGSDSSSTESGNGLSAEEQTEVNEAIYKWYTAIKAWMAQEESS